MVATTDQDLVPNAIVEFHVAKDKGASDAEAWQAAVTRVRYDIFNLAVTACGAGSVSLEKGSERADGYAQCVQELLKLRDTFEA